MKKFQWFILLAIWSIKLIAQPNFRIVENKTFDCIDLHSGAYAMDGDRILFIGGRTNGLHHFLSPLAFPLMMRNAEAVVYDISDDLLYTSSTDVLPVAIKEAVQSSNMQFYQESNTLFMIGGYGWQESSNMFITHPTLTAINVGGLVDAIISGSSIIPFFTQYTDTTMAVCGGHLGKIGDEYYLIFGHRFDGTYYISDTSGFFIQKYTHEIRKFKITNSPLSIYDYSVWSDTMNYRRRDYNLVPQIFPDGTEGYTAFSGVFQRFLNIPYLHPIDIISSEVTVQAFNQFLNNYHCAVVPMYDSDNNTMYNYFIGAMSMYLPDGSGGLVTDSLVPFVKTIACVSRSGSGMLHEFIVDTLTRLEGTNAQFIPATSTVRYANGVIDLQATPIGSSGKLLGYIVGGIISPSPNLNDTDPAASSASCNIYNVYIDYVNDWSDIAVNPPFTYSVQTIQGEIQVTIITQNTKSYVTVEIYNTIGQKLYNKEINEKQSVVLICSNQWKYQIIFVHISNKEFVVTDPVIIH